MSICSLFSLQIILITFVYYTTLKIGVSKWKPSKCTSFFVQSIHDFYNSFKRLQTRHPSLEIAFEHNKVFLLKLEEQRQPHTLNCPTITLSVVISAGLHTLLYIWHFDSLTLCVCVCGPVSVSRRGKAECMHMLWFLGAEPRCKPNCHLVE